MSTIRRAFVALLAAASATPSPAFESSNGNYFFVFNPSRDIGKRGETQEHSNLRNVQSFLSRLTLPPGAILTAIGDKSGTAAAPNKFPGETVGIWNLGGERAIFAGDPPTGRSLPLEEDDTLVFSQVSVLDPATAIKLRYSGAEIEGKALWNFYEDQTRDNALRLGFLDIFSDTDGGRTKELYFAARDARKKPGAWADEARRKRLAKILPELADDKTWTNFLHSMHKPLLDEWLDRLHELGYAGANVVVRGSAKGVNLFRIMEVHRHKPSDPQFQIGQGTHGPMRLRVGQEVKFFHDPAQSGWTFVGAAVNKKHASVHPNRAHWEEAIEAFGQNYHMHGYREDLGNTGHILFALAGSGDLEVELYPIDFRDKGGAYVLNNDLELVAGTARATAGQVLVKVRNNGFNRARQVEIRVTEGASSQLMRLPMIEAQETLELRFKRGASPRPGAKIRIELDPNKNFVEGGEKRKNNVLEIAG